MLVSLLCSAVHVRPRQSWLLCAKVRYHVYFPPGSWRGIISLPCIPPANPPVRGRPFHACIGLVAPPGHIRSPIVACPRSTHHGQPSRHIPHFLGILCLVRKDYLPHDSICIYGYSRGVARALPVPLAYAGVSRSEAPRLEYPDIAGHLRMLVCIRPVEHRP